MSKDPYTPLPLQARVPTGSELAPSLSPRHTPQSKIERYSWKLLDEPGEFKMIHKAELVIDENYQRKLSNIKVTKLAREWSWIACGAISVSWREPLERHLYYVMEGQHRVAAAQRRSDIDAMPCLVFKSLRLSEEAQGFINANSQRAPLTMAQRHHGALIAGTHGAIVTDELARSIGRTVAAYSDHSSITCVQAMLHAIETDEAALRRIFTLVGLICEGRSLPRSMLAGMFYIETHLPDGQSLASNKLSQRLLDRGYQRIMDGIASAMRLRGKGKPSTAAEGILAVLNWKARHPIKLAEQGGDDS